MPARWTVKSSRLFLVILAAPFWGCQSKPQVPPAPEKIDFTRALPPGEVALRKIPPEQYPDFAAAIAGADLAKLRAAVEHSIAWIGRPGSQKSYPYLDITHERAAASLRAFRDLLNDPQLTSMPSALLNRRIADVFEVYQSIGAPRPDGTGYTNKVLFTGYYTPTYDASLTRGGAFQWPLYKRPADLISDEQGEIAHQRLANGQLVPYPARKEIEGGQMALEPLVWLTSRWNAYVVTVQGSARLRLPDGRILEVGYAGTNGQEYVSPGRAMVAAGIIPVDQLNFDTMRGYFEAHPESMDNYLWLNPRTTFFTESPGGPFGSLNVPVTAMTSIATDKKVYPPGMLALMHVRMPAAPVGELVGSGSNFHAFVLDQDRGGAIRSAGRCDLYMGIGQSAEHVSGYQLNAGALYYLFIKPQRVAPAPTHG